jgi:choline-glycine betaine transporter
MAVVLLFLFLLVVLAAASFFRRMLAASLVLLALPVVVLLHAGIGTLNSAFAIATVVIVVALIQTITGSLKLLRDASAAPTRRPHDIPSRHRTSTRRSNRSRIAA